MNLFRRSLTSRARRLVVAVSAVVTAAIGFSMTPQVTFAATPITPSDYYATFDGSSTYTESAGVIPTSGDFTVEAWVYENGKNVGSGGTVISQGGFYIALNLSTQGLRGGDSWTPNYTTSTGNVRQLQLPAYQWVHLAIAKSGTMGKYFINGVQVATGTMSNPNSDVTRIGRMWGNYSEYWKGSIDEVKVFNTDRSASIATDMNSRVAPNTSGLLAYYDFNEGSGKTAFNVATAGAGQNSNMNIRPITSSISYTDTKTVSTRTGNTSRKVVTFAKTYITSNGGWSVPAGVTSLNVLTVGGGGGGGANYGGGGGAGGFKEATLAVAPGSVQTVTVGYGGRGSQTNLNYSASAQQVVEATNGGATTFGSQTVAGGGYGMSADFLTVGNGASGGGGTLGNAGGTGISGQGFAGGTGYSPSGVSAGGGGGAGATGSNGSSSSVLGGNGGIGKVSFITGTSTDYAGGGGGGTHTSNGSCAGTASGGSGGGGNPGTCVTGANSVSDGNDGGANYGGGGGGGSVYAGRGAQGGHGGPGVVIVSYIDATPTAPSGQCDSYSYVKNIGGTNYTIVEFQQTGSCTWNVPTGVTSLDMLAVGAGGGGGNNVGAGGSGGGSAYRTGVTIAAGTAVTVVVGSGGAGALTNQSGSNGGDSSVNWTGNGTSTVGGGGLGGKQIWSNNTCGGGAGAVYNAYSSAGGAAGVGGSQGGASGAGSTSNGVNPTNGANGYTNSITGDIRWYAGGGGGGSWGGTVYGWPGTYGAPGAPTGSAAPATALANTGSGGGAGGDGCGNGSAGASGTVIIRYTATNTGVALGLDRNAIGAPTSAATTLLAQPKVSIKDGSGNAVSTSGVVVTASGTGLTGTTTATTDSSGVATFTNLQVTSSTTSISFSAPNLQGISQTFAAAGVSGNLTISTAASSGGYFEGGVWLANTDNTATTLNTTDLQTALATGDVSLPAKAAIAVNNSISASTTCGNLLFAATASSTASISFANSVSVSTNCSGSSIFVQSATNIVTGTSVTLQTPKAATANLVLWADTDRSVSAGGYISFGQNTFLNTSNGATTSAQSGGGGIWIAGGAMGSDGFPAGYAFSNTAGAPGVDFNAATNSATGFRVYTGGGNLTMRGESSTFIGIRGAEGTTIDSGVGSITITGLSTTSSTANPHPIELNVQQAFPLTLTSAKPSGDAITINGTSTTTANDSIPISVIGGSATNGTTFSATGATGNIVMNAVGGTNSDQAIRLMNFNAYTVGGNITVDAGVKGFTWCNFNNGVASVNIGAASGSSSTGTFILKTDKLLTDTDPFNVRMAKVVVEPSGTNFAAAQSLPIPGWTFSNTTDFRFGKSAATASDITVSGFTFPGNLEVYGRTLAASGNNTITNNFDLYGITVEISGTQMVSGVGKRFMAKATGLVRVATGGTVRTYGGLLSLWADSDSTGGGSVVLKSSANNGAFLCTTNTGLCGTATTGGGDIVLGGGAVETDTSLTDYNYRPGGWATGSTLDTETGTTSGNGAANNYNGGVYLGTADINNGSTQIYSAGGNITVRGKTNSGAMTNWSAAVPTPGGLTINSGAGKIFIDAWMAGTANGGPIEFNAWGGTTSYKSSNTADDSIKISAHSSSNVGNVWGGNAGTTFTNTSGGGFVLQADAINDNLLTKYNVTGKIAIEPYGSAWYTTPNFDNDYSLVTSTPSVIRFGKAGATGTVRRLRLTAPT